MGTWVRQGKIYIMKAIWEEERIPCPKSFGESHIAFTAHLIHMLNRDKREWTASNGAKAAYAMQDKPSFHQQ